MPSGQGLQEQGATGALQSSVEMNSGAGGEGTAERVRGRKVRQINPHPAPREWAPQQAYTDVLLLLSVPVFCLNIFFYSLNISFKYVLKTNDFQSNTSLYKIWKIQKNHKRKMQKCPQSLNPETTYAYFDIFLPSLFNANMQKCMSYFYITRIIFCNLLFLLPLNNRYFPVSLNIILHHYF